MIDTQALAFKARNATGTEVSLDKFSGELLPGTDPFFIRTCIAADGRKSVENISVTAAKALAIKCITAKFEIIINDGTLA